MDASGLSPLGRAAVEYTERGFAIIPLVPVGKVPAIEGGLKNWSDNPDDAAKYWAERPSANIAVVCGSPSHNVIAIDLDCHGGPDGRETLKAWEAEHGELPETVSVITGSGGKHLLYRVRESFAKFENAQMGVDVRAEGSYIVAPPSIHPNGEPYEWSVSPDDMDVAEANDLVYEFIEFVRPAKDEGGEREKFVLPDVIDKDRNKHLFSYASSLRATGRGEEEIKILVHHVHEINLRNDQPFFSNKLAILVPLERGRFEFKSGTVKVRLGTAVGLNLEVILFESVSKSPTPTMRVINLTYSGCLSQRLACELTGILDD